jgi:hypothetical protein
MQASDDTWKIEETEEPGEDEADELVSYEILNYPADTTLKGYLEQWDAQQLRVPPFQRLYVWDLRKASKLIESFLLGLPVPGVFLFKERESAHFLIIDGQQRISSVVAFQKELFNDKAVFRLQNVAPQWNGKKFRIALPPSDREPRLAPRTNPFGKSSCPVLKRDDDPRGALFPRDPCTTLVSKNYLSEDNF